MENRYHISRNRYHSYDPPSFSSTLLDSIYRSFDDSALHSSSSEMAVKSTTYSRPDMSERRTKGSDGRRSRDRIVDSWMEKTGTSHDDFGARRRHMITSSDSSSIGGFSSSDTDSFYRSKTKNKSLKPIRTSQSESFSDDLLYRKNRRSDDKPSKNHGSGSGRTAKARAMKFYGDLKRMKQPISPGGKLATFLNSLFNATSNPKKQRISTSMPATNTSERCDGGKWEGSESKSNYTTTTTSTPTCSTASSYSRSCLSKTPSSSTVKRSVRFCPVSVTIDEDLTTSATRSENSKSAVTVDPELKLRAMEKNKRVEEAAMELLRNYNKKWELSGAKDEDEDMESCCSSDLFELENLLEIGVDRYCAELPVYETTHVDTNRAIANGLIL